jgi:uncharacterized protein YdhG (YjbR/CyaY superfamily)
MGRTNVSTVDQYIAAQPQPVRATLTRVRQAIRKAMPKADELISYGMPVYKLAGKPCLYFAAWKQHYSLYPATRHVCEALGDDLAPYKVQRSTIRFEFTDPVPDKLIVRVAKVRAQEVKTKAQ